MFSFFFVFKLRFVLKRKYNKNGDSDFVCRAIRNLSTPF